MTRYDQSFEPPAPIAKISLRKIESGERIKDVLVMLDTGADISLIPTSSIQNLNINSSGEKIRLSGFSNNNGVYDVYELQVIFLGIRFTGKFCSIDDNIGILGRDVLNQVSIVLTAKILFGERVRIEFRQKSCVI